MNRCGLQSVQIVVHMYVVDMMFFIYVALLILAGIKYAIFLQNVVVAREIHNFMNLFLLIKAEVSKLVKNNYYFVYFSAVVSPSYTREMIGSVNNIVQFWKTEFIVMCISSLEDRYRCGVNVESKVIKVNRRHLLVDLLP